VDDQQGDFTLGARIEIGRWAMTHAIAPTARGVQLHTGSFDDDGEDRQYAAIGLGCAITCRD
jgi:hypothetical protein